MAAGDDIGAGTLRPSRRGLRWIVSRLVYGAVMEKAWRVSTLKVPDGAEPLAHLQNSWPEEWTTYSPSGRHSLLADPFFAPEGRILAEGLNRSSGTGEIVEIDPDGGQQRLPHDGGHLSFPQPVSVAGEALILPESAAWSPPTFFAREGGRLVPRAPLDIDAPRLLDPVLVQESDAVYLFANRAEEGSDVLRLWIAPHALGRVAEHPASPVRSAPTGSRMGGPLLDLGGRRLRVGQDFIRDYGDGVILYDVQALSPAAYREREIARVSFADVPGPHTLNLEGNLLLFDWYEDRFAPLAGWRRLRARLSRKAES